MSSKEGNNSAYKFFRQTKEPATTKDTSSTIQASYHFLSRPLILLNRSNERKWDIIFFLLKNFNSSQILRVLKGQEICFHEHLARNILKKKLVKKAISWFLLTHNQPNTEVAVVPKSHAK